MPLLAALLEVLFAKVLGLMALLFAKKVALALAGMTALVAIGSALYATLAQVVIPLAAQLFSTSYGSIIGLAFPPIAGPIILSIMAIWSACALYAFQRSAIRQITGV